MALTTLQRKRRRNWLARALAIPQTRNVLQPNPSNFQDTVPVAGKRWQTTDAAINSATEIEDAGANLGLVYAELTNGVKKGLTYEIQATVTKDATASATGRFAAIRYNASGSSDGYVVFDTSLASTNYGWVTDQGDIPNSIRITEKGGNWDIVIRFVADDILTTGDIAYYPAFGQNVADLTANGTLAALSDATATGTLDVLSTKVIEHY